MEDIIFESEKKPVISFDWITFIIIISLVAVGLMSIYSATLGSNMEVFFARQLFSAGIGLIVMLAIVFMPESWIRFNAFIVYGISIALLLLVFIIGREINGTKGWIRFGGLSLQPSELAKIGALVAVAKFIAKKGIDIRVWRDLLSVILFILPPAFLILLQPDFGSASVMIAMMGGILFWAGFDAFTLYFIVSVPFIIISSLKGTWWMVAITTIFTVGAFIFRRNIVVTVIVAAIFVSAGVVAPLVYEGLAPHQKERIDTFLNPGSNPLGAGYNVMQSLMAVGSGGVSGKGFTQGTQTQLRYIPMQWTDFIYSVPSEEFGFVGGAIVIALHFGLIWRAIITASIVANKFYSIICIGAATIFFYHTTINIGMAIGIMPVMGIPLPFMSYGGTSLIMTMGLGGLILNAHRQHELKRSV